MHISCLMSSNQKKKVTESQRHCCTKTKKGTNVNVNSKMTQKKLNVARGVATNVRCEKKSCFYIKSRYPEL